MWRAPRGCTTSFAFGSRAISSPAPPAWSRCTWVRISQSTSAAEIPASSSAASMRGTAKFVPQSMKAPRPFSTTR